MTTGLCIVAGEITTTANIDFTRIARETIGEIGYNDAAYRFDAQSCAVITAVDEQSPDIAIGVDPGVRRRPGIDVSATPATRRRS